MVRQILKNLIKDSLIKLQKQDVLPDFELPEIQMECPADSKNGDYSTNIAMRIAKIAKKPPLEIADAIVSEIEIKDSKIIERVMAVIPGFINFFLSQEFLQEQVEKIFKKDFGKLEIGKGKKVNVEFISANPTGPLHVGNGRGAFFGDVLANILEKSGYKVDREYFINDAEKSNQIEVSGGTAIMDTVSDVVDKNIGIELPPADEWPYYNEYFKEKIASFGRDKIFNLGFDEKRIGYLLSQEIQKDNQNFIEKELKIKFDKWFFEQKEIFNSGKVEKIFQELKKKGLTYEKEGATWLKTSEFGDEKDWVIVRSDGEPSYFLSDIAYHKDKIERGFNEIIDIWGADHQGHVQKMQAAMKTLDYKGEFDVLITQLVRLKTGKMSKRTGEIITLEDLIKEVGLDVARFFYLTKSLNTQMEFDLDLAKEQSEKNPVYYVQYAYARIHSILAKSKISARGGSAFGGKSQKSKIHIKNQKLNLLSHERELNLIKQLIRFPEIVEDTAKDYQVQRLPQYAVDLATSFHQFYRDCRVLVENKDLEKARLALIMATKIVLKQTLGLMGISAPEKM